MFLRLAWLWLWDVRRVCGLRRKGFAGDWDAPLGVGTHFVERWLVRPAHHLAVGAGFGARVDGRSAGWDRAVGCRSHVVQGRLARARSGNGRTLCERWLHWLVSALDARA